MNSTTKLPKVTPDNYFAPEIQMAYMGHSQYLDFCRCEAGALAKLRGGYELPPSEAMLAGSYVDAYFSGELDQFEKTHPELFRKDGTPRSLALEAQDVANRMEEDELYSMLMSGEKQVIRTGEIAGVPFKIKIDSLLDETICKAISQRFPDTLEALGFCDGAIVDQKVMRSLDNVWSAEYRRPVTFVEAWGYDVQGAVYQAVEGRMLPFLLAVGTREKPSDLAALYIPDGDLAVKLYEVEDNAPRFQAIKDGREKPRRCEHCPYCRGTRSLRTIVYYKEAAGHGDTLS